ncbi:fimbria/pilus outer membrane usher protein [Achromobacter sp. SS2-2022]|uniref:fimbria/pilus outer membrane usher protein n=1 Tax=Achromobacter sp. SS2-2022 TaxID=2980498 RepID=UPI002404DE98|nr:fimbria/pilus outer membrane usher protein [Achromobacter sp. SS2-2022]WEX93654.1 fimbria/pilus outer membrane usher protein [Achromobacter sp. SS2-2022]
MAFMFCLCLRNARGRTLATASLLLCLHWSAYAQSGAGGFDLEILKSRGLNPAIASHFQNGPQFLPGHQTVHLTVNGRNVGRTQATFDTDGKLCLTNALLTQAELKVPVSQGNDAPVCPDAFLQAWPTTTISLQPERMTVEIVAPPGAMNRVAGATTYQSGGRAVILNYDVLSNQTRYIGGKSNYLQAYTELGLNANDWILRSNSTYSNIGGTSTWNHIDAYAQRTLPAWGTTFQAGQINLQGTLFGGVPVTGLQLFPETALQSHQHEGPPISGIAHTQARVEVWQNGIPLASLIVPPGPFTMTDVQPRSLTQDIKVVIHEASGEERVFYVPAAALQVDRVGAAAGFSGGLGMLRQTGTTDANTRPVAAAEYGIPLGKRANIAAGALLTQDYRAISGRSDMVLPGSIQAGMQSTYSQNSRTERSGAQHIVSASAQLLPGVSSNISFLRRTDGYSDVLDSSGTRPRHRRQDEAHLYPPHHEYRIKQQISAGLGWSGSTLGGFSANYSESLNTRGNASRRGILSWGKSFSRASLSVSFERDMGSSHRTQGSLMYLNVSLPLGKQSVSASMQRQDNGTSYGVNTSASIGEGSSYALGATTSSQGQTSYSGSVGMNSAYTQLNVAASSFTGGYSHSVRMRGGLVGHAQGLSFSPYRVQDTFAIASVGGLSGVRLSTPAGSVWTDPWGRAVIPSLPAYRNGQIQVATTSLARNVDLINGRYSLEPARGSVSAVDFAVVTVRRALLTATYADGSPVPKGAAVLDAKGAFITLVASGGQIFLPDLQADGAPYSVAPTDDAACTLDFDLPSAPNLDALYERALATCRP